MDLTLRLFALTLGGLMAFEVWRAFRMDTDAEPVWIAVLFGESLDRETAPVRFWIVIACEAGLAATLVVAAFLPSTRMHSLLNTLFG